MAPSSTRSSPRRTTRRLRACALATAALAANAAGLECAVTPCQSAGCVAPVAPFAEEMLDVALNDNVRGEDLRVLRDGAGDLYVDQTSLERWRLRLPPRPALVCGRHAFHNLRTLGALRFEIDAATQTLRIAAAPHAFEASTLRHEAAAPAAAGRVASGGFFNYDLQAQRTGGTDPAVSGLFEAGLFGPSGVLVSSATARNEDGAVRFLRLDTTWSRDWPGEMRTLRIGDLFTQSGAWGRPTRLGGIQYSTNFATRPGFIRMPTLNAVGQTALPSVVDVFVNNAFVTRREVPAGPFAITDIPAVSGNGAVNLVVTDLLGRQQTTSQSFFASSRLLATGVEDVSFEAGLIRHAFAVRSNSYAGAAAAATYRRGLNDAVTGEVRAEASPLARAAGFGADAIARPGLVVSGHVAASQSAAGQGQTTIIGVEHTSRSHSLAIREQRASAAFRQSGGTLDEAPARSLLSASAGVNLAPWGTLGFALARRQTQEGQSGSVASASYNVGIGRLAFLGFTLSRTRGSENRTDAFVTLTVPFGTGAVASTGFTRVRGTQSAVPDAISATYQQNPPAANGWGYLVQTRHPGETQVGATYQGDAGIYTAGVSRLNSQDSVRLGMRGGAGFVADRWFVSRPVTDSFGLVHLPGLAGVGILRDNRLEAVTDAAGYAVLPRLRAFDRNRISVDLDGVPFGIELDRVQQDAVPAYRSGLLLTFAVTRERGATARLLRADGSEVPVGAEVGIGATGTRFPVGLRGLVYLRDLGDDDLLVVTWPGGGCRLRLGRPAGEDTQPDLGEHTCLP